jgi:hypothetical protein
VNNQTFYFEIKDLIVQFLAAFDSCIINRYDGRNPKEKLEVRYVLAPKQRVLYDIVNEVNNITLPVVAVDITSITRDESRVFNKIDGFYLPTKSSVQGKLTSKLPTPVPVNLTVSMSIITKFQLDMDQIISNFVPYNNPYIIISWKIPAEAGLEYETEIRSEVLWDGNISLTPPITLTSGDKYRVTADTTFTIKGWLFKKLGEKTGNIFIVDANFYNLARNNALNIHSLTGFNFSSPVSGIGYDTLETVSVSGIPTITNIFAANSGVIAPITSNTTLYRAFSGNNILIQGEDFHYIQNVLLSSNNTSFLPTLTSLNFYKMPSVSGFALSSSDYNIVSKNTAIITLPGNIQTGKFTILLADEVGYASTYQINNIVFNVV